MRKHYTVQKPTHGSQDWLNLRWKNEQGEARISASVAAAVHGEHQYTSAADLAFELLADAPPAPSTPTAAMDRGNRLEPLLLDWYGDINGVNVTAPDEMFCYDEDDVRLIATLDGISAHDGTPIEVKTYNRRWTGQLSRTWYWQGVQQAICANKDEIEWVIFDSDLEMQRYTQVVTSDEKQQHIEACRRFLAHIDMGMLPEIAQPEYKHATALHPVGNGKTVELPESIVEIVAELAAVRDQQKSLGKVEDDLKAQVCLLLGEAEYGTMNGEPVISWKTANRTTFDGKKFEAEHPALYNKYKTTTPYRTVRVLKGK
jgi:predicted phage-related endonuclease